MLCTFFISCSFSIFMSGFWYGKKVSKLTCRVTHNFLWVDSGSVLCVFGQKEMRWNYEKKVRRKKRNYNSGK